MNVLLYYYYNKLNNPENCHHNHCSFLDSKDIKGRIIISNEGINGTISGNIQDCEDYMKFLKNNEQFKNIVFKINKCNEHLFTKLTIKIKPYLIKLGSSDLYSIPDTGTHLSPNKFKSLMKDENTIILDVRSNYETMIGKFKNSITLDIDKFYHLPEKIKNHSLYLDKTYRSKNILTYCTGGIRCESASSYLKQLGFKNVFQLDGGIINYSKICKGEDFLGKCYVFDGRISIDVNQINPEIISKCIKCKNTCQYIVNCMNTYCDKHMIMCYDCYQSSRGCCSIECQNSNKKRKIIPNYYKNDYNNKNIF